MDNHSFPNAIHPDNDFNNHTDNEGMPALVPLDSDDTEPQQQQQAVIDVEMNGEDSNMSYLASVSYSSSEEHPDSESDRDAHEVEMQTVNDHQLSDHAVPNSSPTPHTFQDQPTVNNRRARVEDDEDEDRDRRHPSQRIGNSANAASSAGPSSSTPIFPSQAPTQPTPGTRLRGQAPIFSRIVVDEATRAHPFRFFQHLMSNNNNTSDNNDAGNPNPVPSSGGPMPASQPHQDGNIPDNQPRGQLPINIEGFSVTLDIGVGPAFHMGGGAQPPEAQPSSNAAGTNPNANPNAQNGPSQVNFADFMARLSQIMGLADITGTPGTATPAGENNPDPGPGGAGATPGAQFGFNLPAGGFNLANLAGLGFGFHIDGTGFREFAEKEDPERARKLVDGIEEVPVGLVRRLERVGGTGGGMGEDETKGGDGGCAICWDRLLGDSGGEEDVHSHEKKEEKSDQASKPIIPKIVSLPCAHVFHAECLIPWFSRPRQTTCPTCRFNIDPENLTYVSWRRRMRERRERERAEARARGDPENTDGNEASAAPSATAATPATTAAGPADAPLPAAPSEHVLNFSSSLESPSNVNIRSQTPNSSVLNAHPTLTPHSQSQPEATATSSTPAASTSQPSTQPITTSENGATDVDTLARSQETLDDWNTMPTLQDVDDSDSEEDEDEDEDEDESGEDGEEQGNGHGVQATPVLPDANERPTTSTLGAQALRARQNGPLAPRTIQTAHGLVTLIPVPFNLPFPTGVRTGVQAGGNAANTQVTPAAGQDRLPNANIQDSRGPAFSHLHSQFPPMPEFGAQRGTTPGASASSNTTPENANANLNQATPTDRFVNAQEAEQQLMDHLLSQGLTADQAESLRRVAVGPLDLEDEDEEDMDMDEGMDMVVDLAMDQGGIDGAGVNAAIAQNEQDRQDFAQILNFLRGGGQNQAQAPQQEQGNQGASAGTRIQTEIPNSLQEQAQARTQAEGQAPQPEQGTERAAAGAPNAQSDAPQQSQPRQQQGQGFAPFMPGLNPGINIGNIGPADGRTINELVAQMFTTITGAPPQQARQQAQDNQSQAQPQNQPRESAETPTNNNNNGGRPRQQTQFTFGNVTIGPLGPFNNFGSLFNQMPTFDPNGAANPNVNVGAGQERVKKEWTLPPAPGPTLRQRIERRERDAGLRCYDISCGVGPSDEDPVVSDEIIAAGLRQLKIMNKNHGADGRAEGVCKHTFHPGCLVSAERVALGSTNVTVIENDYVEVSCPVCRSTGCVTKQEWDEGILALS